MVSKKSLSRTMAGVLPERSRLFNIAFPAAGATIDAGAFWPYAAIRRGLQKRCRDVEELRGDASKNRRVLGATDKVSDLKFLAIMTHANGRPDNITEMLYAAAFSGIDVSEERAKEIDAHLDVTLAYADDGVLYLVASPKIFGAFADDAFGGQLDFFLDDLRNASRLLYEDGSTTRAAIGEVKSLMRVADPSMTAISNRIDARRFHAESVSMFSPREDCETCNGKGKRFLRTCRDCSGRGYRR